VRTLLFSVLLRGSRHHPARSGHQASGNREFDASLRGSTLTTIVVTLRAFARFALPGREEGNKMGSRKGIL
jgi:hypothetical protein